MTRTISHCSAITLLSLLLACTVDDDREEGVFSSGPAGDDGTGGAADTSPGDGDGDGVPGDGDGDDGPKFDVEDGQGSADDGGGELGCEKADFLFIIDNSGSMTDEQQNLVNSFPGFISAIQDTLMAQDYHLMVIDTDAESLSFSGIQCINNVCTCSPEPQCCFALCNGKGIQINPPPTSCAGQSCDAFKDLPMGCSVTLGAGKTNDPLDDPCDFAGGNAYMTDQEPDLEAAFTCAAKVGAGGDGNERPMEAMTEALGPLLQQGDCNEGFLRDDAILVVTFITDEEDKGSMGNPAVWKQALVDAKNGNEEAVVMLGLLGDTGVNGGTCGNGQADDAAVLRQFAESFTNGQWGSVCANDYAPFFLEAVGVIDFACDNFLPPG